MTFGDGADPSQQLLAGGSLEHVPRRTFPQGGLDPGRTAAPREDEGSATGKRRPNPGHDALTSIIGQVDVRDNDIGRDGEPLRLRGVSCLPDDGKVRLLVKKNAQGLAHDNLAVDQNDAYWLAGRRLRLARARPGWIRPRAPALQRGPSAGSGWARPNRAADRIAGDRH